MFATVLATFSGIAVTRDMLPTTVFGWIVVILWSDEVQAYTRAELVLIHQLVTISGDDQGMPDFVLGYILNGVSGCGFWFDQR